MKQLSSNITTWRLCALLSFGLFGSTVAWAENPVELRIEGVKNHALDENIRLHLNAIEKYDTTDIARYQDVVSAAIDKGLRALGYYDSTIQFELKPREGKAPLLIAHVSRENR